MDGINFNDRANQLYDRAQKTLKGSFFSNLSKGKQDRADEAKDLFVQAANCYKLTDNKEAAIRSLMMCIDCEENEIDAAPHYREAASCCQDSDVEKYVEYTKKALDLYSLSGRSTTGATMARDCAQNLEGQYMFEEAIEIYQKACKLYEMDN
jgi:tetratricopeptide (TPR) repeat protein